MDVKIKLCGFTDKKMADIAVSCGVDFTGFVFCDRSSRNITPQKSQQISVDFPQSVKKVAVVVDLDDKNISEIVKYLQPDFFQIHGDQTIQRIQEIKDSFGIKVIKAIAISSEDDLQLVDKYNEVADMFLFDAKNSGSGKSFDWKILNNLNISKEWFLSGGLNVDNVDEAIAITGARIVDLSSGIEEVRGAKSEKMIREFMNHFNNCK